MTPINYRCECINELKVISFSFNIWTEYIVFLKILQIFMWKWSDRIRQKPYLLDWLKSVLCQLFPLFNFWTVSPTYCKEYSLQAIRYHTIIYPFPWCAYCFIPEDKNEFELAHFWFAFISRLTWLIITQFINISYTFNMWRDMIKKSKIIKNRIIILYKNFC